MPRRFPASYEKTRRGARRAGEVDKETRRFLEGNASYCHLAYQIPSSGLARKPEAGCSGRVEGRSSKKRRCSSHRKVRSDLDVKNAIANDGLSTLSTAEFEEMLERIVACSSYIGIGGKITPSVKIGGRITSLFPAKIEIML